MATQQDLRAMIARSALLSPDQKQYWLSSLPHMTEEQLAKLAGMLTEAEQLLRAKQAQ